MSSTRCIALTLALALAISKTSAGQSVDFARDVRPILSENCFPCHGPDAQAREAELRLDRPEGLTRHRDGDAIVVPKRPDQSLLWQRVTTSNADERMPPADSTLSISSSQIDLIRRWIEDGARWNEHWSYTSLERPRVPNVQLGEWPRNAIDSFVLARLEQEGLAPSPLAKRETLIRRVTLDLTGLPPTLDEVDDFLNDTSADAYERVVDRLINSDRYGERMAWDWLEAARYADTNGFQGDPTRTMWPWRDWLVQVLNQNLPYDQFTIEMLAGDLLPGATTEQVIATGFNRNHMYNGEGGRIPEETRVENVFDRNETTATVWLGLTMTCARCHDHKYDPISQREYYQLYSFFNNTSESGRGPRPQGNAEPYIPYVTAQLQSQLDESEKKRSALAEHLTREEKSLSETDPSNHDRFAEVLAQLEQGPRDSLAKPVEQRGADELETLGKAFREPMPQYAELLLRLARQVRQDDELRKAIPQVMVMDELPTDKRRQTSILTKGIYNKPVEPVVADVPAFLPKLPLREERNRLSLARWLVNPTHPLPARVTVNRYWQMFFATGLVKTSEDFGSQGQRPTHPRLLDWLASSFIESGWNVKKLHRLIVTSATYRQSSQVTRELAEQDPENKLLARASRFRLPSWMLRDQALALSGLLVRQVGGPPVRPYQPPGVWSEATFGKKRYVQDSGAKLYRRSVYTFWRRIVGPTTFFDEAKRQTCSVTPTRTNTPLHALTTLNDTTYVEASRCLAQRVLAEGGALAEEDHPRTCITRIFRSATARLPNEQELDLLETRLASLKSEFQAHPDRAEALTQVGEWPRDASQSAVGLASFTALCTLILNLDEVLSRE